MGSEKKSGRMEQWEVDKLISYDKNSRTHSEEQIAQIAASIEEFGFLNPILVDGRDSTMIAGHGRLMAAKKMGLAKVPVVVFDHLSDAQRRAYVIADNKLALSAGWDEEVLAAELTLLIDEGFGLELTGFSDEEFSDLVERTTPEQAPPSGDDDAIPETPAEPITKPGDIYILGKHRLMCGDSTSVDAFDRLMPGETADLIFTDPPYGMSYGGGRAQGDHSLNKKTGGVFVKSHGMIMNDDLQGDDLIQLVRDALTTAKVKSKTDAAAYVCFTWRTYSQFESGVRECGYDIKACIVWDKKSIGLGNSHYRPQHEFIFYCKGDWQGDKSQSDVWCLSRGATGEYVHPTQKPVELIERALVNSSKKGEIVIDCFGGSGSTLIAAEKLGRAARIMELDPKYCDVIVARWEKYTGKKASLLGSESEVVKLDKKPKAVRPTKKKK